MVLETIDQMSVDAFIDSSMKIKKSSFSDQADFSKDEIMFYLTELMEQNKLFVADDLVTKL